MEQCEKKSVLMHMYVNGTRPHLRDKNLQCRKYKRHL